MEGTNPQPEDYVVKRYDFFPFGGEIPSGTGDRTTAMGYGGDWVNPKFTAKLRDYESGLNLDYFGARYYAGAMGRFTSADKPLLDQNAADPQSWNLYAYVRNNPLKYTDPNGEVCFFGIGNTCDEEMPLPPPPPPPPPPPAPDLLSPIMAPSIAGLQVNTLTVQEVGNVVFNETQSPVRSRRLK